MSSVICPVRCPLCNHKIVYNTKPDRSPYLMCPNKSCDWVQWNVPDSVMDDYEVYISDYETEGIYKFYENEYND